MNSGQTCPLHYATAFSIKLSESRQMTTWEYLTTPLMIHNTAAILTNWGSQGWELVQVVTGPEGGLVAYFKRPTGTDSHDHN